MKKFLIGCGIVALIAIVCISGFVIWGGRKMYKLGAGMQEAQAEMVRVNSAYPFIEPPANTALSPSRYDQYIAVRNELTTRILEVPFFAKLSAASANPNAPAPQPTVSEIFGMIGAIPDVIKDFAASLDAAAMSVDEYEYMTIQTFQAIGAGAKQNDPQLTPLWDQLTLQIRQTQTQIDQQKASNPNLQGIDMMYTLSEAEEAIVPQENVELVKENIEEFADGPMALAMELLVLQFIRQSGATMQMQQAPSR